MRTLIISLARLPELRVLLWGSPLSLRILTLWRFSTELLSEAILKMPLKFGIRIIIFTSIALKLTLSTALIVNAIFVGNVFHLDNVYNQRQPHDVLPAVAQLGLCQWASAMQEEAELVCLSTHPRHRENSKTSKKIASCNHPVPQAIPLLYVVWRTASLGASYECVAIHIHRYLFLIRSFDQL